MTTRVQYSVWAESRGAGMILRLIEREWAPEDPVGALAKHLGWSRGRAVSRLRIDRGIPGAAMHLARVSEARMELLPLARLLDVARKPSLRAKAVCLSYAVHGRDLLRA